MTAPFGRRLCEVAGVPRHGGGYRVVSLVDREGPAAGGRPVLHAGDGGGLGVHDGRAFLPRAISVAETMPAAGGGIRLDFLLDAVGPGTGRLYDLEAGEGVWVTGPLGNSFAAPREVTPDAAGRSWSAAGSAWRRWRCCANGSPSAPSRTGSCSASATAPTPAASTSSAAPPGALPRGKAGDRGRPRGRPGTRHGPPVADPDGDDAGLGVVYTCGPPAMLEAVRALCAEHGVACELALESPMACGFGACFGCAVPKPGGGFLRLCVDGPVLRGDEVEEVSHAYA